jgi:chemotaxis protein MotB
MSVKKVYSEYQLKVNTIKSELNTTLPNNMNTVDFKTVAEDGRLLILIPNSILFPAGNAELDLNSLQLIQELAVIFKKHPGLQIRMEGHTDDTPLRAGSDYADNWDLSLARSVMLVRELAKHGVNPLRMTAAGKGELAPRNTADSEEARIENSRTEIIFLPEVSKLVKATSEL